MEDKLTTGDIVHAVVKGVIGSAPYVGGLGAEIFGFIIQSPMEKRQLVWKNEIGLRLEKLEAQKKINIDELSKNDEFIDTVFHATTQAIRTSEKEKLEHLRNAVLNTAEGFAPESAIRHIYLECIQSFTPLHVRLLEFAKDPNLWLIRVGKQTAATRLTSLRTLIREAIPELSNKIELMDLLWNDLQRYGMTNWGGIGNTMATSELIACKASEFGKGFLVFITRDDE